MLLKKIKQPVLLYSTLFLCSLALTALMLVYRQPLNSDSIATYFKAARAFSFSLGGLKAVTAIYPWPLYPILMGSASKIFHLSFASSAHFLDAICDALTIIMFAALIKELGGSRKTQWIGALVILFFPYLNHLRDSIVRGHGYYCFSLIALFFLIRYLRHHRFRDAIAWGLFILTAALFRIEGILIAAFAPLVLLFKPKTSSLSKIATLLKAYSIQIIGALCLAGYILSLRQHHDPLSTQFLGRLPEFKRCFFDLFVRFQLFTSAVGIIKTKVLSVFASDQAVNFAVGGLIAVYCSKLISTLALSYTIAVIYGFIKKAMQIDWAANAALFIWITINIAIMAFFLTQHFFLTTRYLALLSFLLLLYVPFAIEKLFDEWRIFRHINQSAAVGFPLFLLLWFATALGSIYHFGPSGTYVIDAGQWIQKQIPPEKTLYLNNLQLAYYANREKDLKESDLQDPTLLDKIKHYDYTALKIQRFNRTFFNKIKHLKNLKIIRIFSNKRGDKVVVLKVLLPAQ